MAKVDRPNLVWFLVEKLRGWTHDLEQLMDELNDEGVIDVGFNQLTKEEFASIDRLAWPCKECSVWHHPRELEDETCSGCRPTPKWRE